MKGIIRRPPHVIYIEVTEMPSERKEHPPQVYIGQNNFLVFFPPTALLTHIGGQLKGSHWTHVARVIFILGGR